MYKNGRQCTKYRHIWPKSRTQAQIIHNLFWWTCLPYFFLLSLFCVGCVLLFNLDYNLLVFVFLVSLSKRLNCFAASWFFVLIFSLSHDLIIIGIINNITYSEWGGPESLHALWILEGSYAEYLFLFCTTRWTHELKFASWREWNEHATKQRNKTSTQTQP